MQPVDLTTLVAVCHELGNCLPARLEQVFQSDRHTLYLSLRTLEQKLWLQIAWHPQLARIHLSSPPPKQSDTFTFSQQIWHQVMGLALVKIALVSPWERVVDLQFAKRPDDPVLVHLYAEIMGKYSNVVLVNSNQEIISAAHQVSAKQSRVRPIQTGDRYALPPALLDNIPTVEEPIAHWQENLSLIPQPILKSLMSNYRGVSSSLGRSLLTRAEIAPHTPTDQLTPANWQKLHNAWQYWLHCLDAKDFQPARTSDGYTVLASVGQFTTANALIASYYQTIAASQEFQQLHSQIQQALHHHLQKLQIKAQSFADRLSQSDQAEAIKTHADLLMANIHSPALGQNIITINDFHSLVPITISLDPQLSIVQNAQALYKKYQKQKRAKVAIAPLLQETNQEIQYLHQVVTALGCLETGDVKSLQEIHQELCQQAYLKSDRPIITKKSKPEPPNCHRFTSPSGYEIWVGRNNYQNDQLTFKVASAYDLWLHTQEIPGSHVLLRLEPGAIAEPQDLQTAANLAAYYSQARHSDRVPVVFTKPQYVFKPKGAKPGMVVYQQEQIIWGQPTAVTPH